MLDLTGFETLYWLRSVFGSRNTIYYCHVYRWLDNLLLSVLLQEVWRQARQET